MIARERARLIDSCTTSRAEAKRTAAAKILEAVKALAEERGHQARLMRQPGKPGKIQLIEKSRESDDEVRGNIDAELWPVWEKIRAKIRPGVRSSRTETFLQWVHDHHGEAQRIIAEHHAAEAEREYRQMIASEKKLAKRVRSSRAQSLEAIPF